MNTYANEDVMWQRLKDIQAEAENSRLLGRHGMPATVALARLLARRGWWLAGLAMRRAPRRSPLAVSRDADSACDAA